MVLIKIAWRNIWRNKLRSSMVILSLILGIWAGLFLMGMTLGLNDQRMRGAMDTYLSHIQIHHPSFDADQNLKFYIKDKEKLQQSLANNPLINQVSFRSKMTGMAANSKGAYGVQVLGVNPEEEMKITTIHRSIKDGSYFEKFKRNPVIVGAKLAKKLKLKIRSKLVISFQNFEGDMVSASFRVEGIFKTSNSMFDESTLFVRKQDLDAVTGLEGQFHEVALLCSNLDDLNTVTAQLQKASPKSKISTWKDIAPELAYAEEIMGQMIYIFMGIVLLALAFSIVNTMLMAVLERKKELGMLAAVGMNKKRIFTMITLETIFISLIATPIGVLLSYWSITYFGEHGIDLSEVAEGLENLGIGAIVYTYLPNNLYFNITLMTLLVAFIASLFPARRALKMKPTEAFSS